MNAWKYELRSNEDDSLLLTESGFETEEDAYLQGKMEAKAGNIKNYHIRTLQEWIDL